MRFRRSLLIIVVTLLCFGGMLLSANANSNNQIVLSATGISTSVGPGGFWIWSQPGGSNAYGNGGAGNMYFYALTLQRAVDVHNVVLSGATVNEDVSSRDGAIVCHFSATETSRPSSQHAVNGVVSFSCSAPTGAAVTDAPATVRISNF